MRYVAGEPKALVEWEESKLLDDTLPDQLGEEDEVKGRRRVFEMEKRFL